MIPVVKKIFPSVGDYVESLLNPVGRFASLIGVCAVTDVDDELIYVSGTGRVTFKVVLGDSTQQYDMTCFTSSITAEAVMSAESYSGQMLQNELYVFNNDQTGNYYPIVLHRIEDTGGGVTDSMADFVLSVISEQDSGEIYEDRRVIVRDGLFGYADQMGTVLVEPTYVWAGDFREGRAMVAVSASQGDGVLMGLIDKQGNLIIPAEYDDLSWDESRYAYVEREGRHGCLDRMGLVVIPLEYDWTGEFSYGFAVVSQDDRYGYVDARGVVVGEGLVYTDATSVSEDGTAEVLCPCKLRRMIIHLETV